MHLILDSNICASDYRMTGVSFRTLFDYLRRTDSKIVLPRLIREEVVHDYGRRLKAESKEFAEVHNRYRHLDLERAPDVFKKPDIKYAMTRLRRKLMKPQEGVRPIYFDEIQGVSLSDVFMRGVQRTRPANEQGEELRDVIIWLWAREYCGSVLTKVAFISNDTAFWEKDALHPQIQRDIGSTTGALTVHRSIDDFIKQHAPAPVEATTEWLNENVHLQSFERELLDLATQSINSFARHDMTARDLTLERFEFQRGNVFQVAPDTQFAELGFALAFKFTALLYRNPNLPLAFSTGVFPKNAALAVFGPGQYTYNQNFMAAQGVQSPLLGPFGQQRTLADLNPQTRELRCDGSTNLSVRTRTGSASEIAIEDFKLDTWKLYLELAGTKK